ncbi:MAG: hypothetical protein RLZZ435_1446 [Cyanobacteriota bacterium]|jgi:hypothetical protein
MPSRKAAVPKLSANLNDRLSPALVLLNSI